MHSGYITQHYTMPSFHGILMVGWANYNELVHINLMHLLCVPSPTIYIDCVVSIPSTFWCICLCGHWV